MGEQNIRANADEQTRRKFMKSLLNEVQALELMLEEGLFERGARRIGAEQEFFLLDGSSRPAWRALDLLDVLKDERYTNELGLFNFEANLSPQTYTGQCLRTMEAELQAMYEHARDAAKRIDCQVAMCGILPTLSKPDLSLDAMMPSDRYCALNEALLKLRGSDFHININGLDTLSLRHDNLMLEACNTSFQTHFRWMWRNFPACTTWPS